RVGWKVFARKHAVTISQLDMGRSGCEDGGICKKNTRRVELFRCWHRAFSRLFVNIGSDHEPIFWICEMNLIRSEQNSGERLVVFPQFGVDKISIGARNPLLPKRTDGVEHDALMKGFAGRIDK